MKKEAEYYFIQFLFCENRHLLTREFRPAYDALFQRYMPIYKDGRDHHIELLDIQNKFRDSLFALKK